ncbi:MAG: transporter substrate-binding domain-containing protein [Geobacter sp.]|nr:transporter substrate-binding domain-containing protein [Geobacter sp.]
MLSLLTLCALLLAATPTLAVDPSTLGEAAATGGENQGQRPVIVGGNRGYPPYEFIDESGKPAGFTVDLLRAIADVMGMKLDIRLGEWARVHDDLVAGRIDMTLGMSQSADREKVFDLPTPHTIVQHAIFARKETKPVKSLEELRGKRVIVHRNGAMHQQLVKMGFSDELVFAETPADGLRLLSSGEADYAVAALLPGMYIIREHKLTNLQPVARDVMAFKFSFAVREGNAQLQAQLNEGLAILKKTGKYQEIYEKWLGVLEPSALSRAKAIRYGAAVLLPLLLLLAAYIFWSRSLKKRVDLRTAELAREIGEKKKALDDLRLHQDQLIQADKMASLGVLVSGVAHEVNNPNGLILLNMPIIAQTWEDALLLLEEIYRTQGDFDLGGISYSRMREEMPHILDETTEAARKIKRIVEDLKDFARQDIGEIVEKIDFNEVIRAALRLVEPTTRQATNHLSINLSAEPLFVRGSAQRIEQVVINLMVNACRALPDREKGITVTTSLDRKQQAVIMQLSDEGVGIPLENLHKVTDPFFTTHRENGGTGLGLSISAGIVKELGGTLKFDSIVGVGTTVTLSLPATRGNA